MARKKSVKKSPRKKTKKKNISKTEVMGKKKVSRKTKSTLVSLMFSLIVFAISWIGYVYLFVDGTLLGNTFFILTYLSGFISLAFLIALLVFLILKAFRK